MDAHVAAHAHDDGLVVGLQLTHSGRWSRPDRRAAAAHRLPPSRPRRSASAPTPRRSCPTTTSTRSSRRYADAAALAADAGLRLRRRQALSRLPPPRAARRRRPAGRVRRDVRAPHRVPAPRRRGRPRPRARPRPSACGCRRTTSCPSKPDADGVGAPVARRDARWRATRSAPTRPASAGDLAEAHRFLDLCRELGIGLVCITAGSPYYNPHIQRPAFFPPSDGYTPPEDPLVGAARMIAATAELDARASRPRGRRAPATPTSSSGSPTPRSTRCAPVARSSVGIGRGMLSYPHLPADVLAGRRCRRRCCAARSATAPPRPATGSCPAVTRSTTSTRSPPSASSSPRSRRRRGSGPVDEHRRPVSARSRSGRSPPTRCCRPRCARVSRASSGAPTGTSLRAEVPRSRHCAPGVATRASRSCRTAPTSGSRPPTADETGHDRRRARLRGGARCADGPDLDRARREPRVTRRRPPTRHRAHRALRRRDRRARPHRRARVPSVHADGDRRLRQRAARPRLLDPTCGRTGSPTPRCPPRPRWPSSRRSRRISRTCTPSSGARPASTIATRSPTAPTSGRRPSNSPIEHGAQLPGRRFALCEYVRDDDPEQLVADVDVLRRWLRRAPRRSCVTGGGLTSELRHGWSAGKSC